MKKGKKKEALAIAFSDIHFNKWKQFNEEGFRLYDSIRALGEIADQCIFRAPGKNSLPLLFSGDLFHNPKTVSNDLFNQVCSGLKSMVFSKGIQMYAISGNHDQYQKNTYSTHSPSWLNGIAELNPNFHVVDYRVKTHRSIGIYGIPYLKHNEGFSKALENFKQYHTTNLYNILLIHTDIPGAVDCSNRKIEEVEGLPLKLKKAFKGYTLVLNGHIHKPQENIPGKLITLGSPIHQIKSDEGEAMGYWVIYKDRTYEFVKLKGYPRFITLKQGEKPKGTKNFYIQPIKKVKEFKRDTVFQKGQDRGKMAEEYCKQNKVSPRKTRVLIKILEETYEESYI